MKETHYVSKTKLSDYLFLSIAGHILRDSEGSCKNDNVRNNNNNNNNNTVFTRQL